MAKYDDKSFSREALEAQADDIALKSSLHTSGREAWQRVQAGELEGTLLASRLAQIYFLIGESEPTSCAVE